jgi:hypothetical protein
MTSGAPSPPRVAVGTIVAANYLAFARVLAHSLHEHHPEVPFFTVVLDNRGHRIEPAPEPFELRHVLGVDELGIPQVLEVCFRNSLKELAVIIKPYLLRHLLDRRFDAAVFLDPDVLITGDLTDVFSTVTQHAVTLTPHLLTALDGRDRVARELNIVQSGTFNAGFIGVSAGPTARRFLAWWQDRLHGDCSSDVSRGVYYDQRWLDLAPVLFADVCVMRDPGCNVAHWNLTERPITGGPDAMRVNGGPCRFLHFSGIDPDRPELVSKYSRHLSTAAAPSAADIAAHYASLLQSAGHSTLQRLRYGFGYFENGIAIPDEARERHRQLGADADRFGDPFQCEGRESFYAWWSAQATTGTETDNQ